MKVFLSQTAERKLLNLNDYLLEKWSEKVKNDFFKKFEDKLKLIVQFPEICPQSKIFEGLFKCVVTKQTTFYYRVNYDVKEIEVVTVIDTRQDLNKLKEDFNNY